MSNRIINIAAFFILAALWIGFMAALVLNPNLLLTAWQSLQGLPLVAQLAVWLLTLPVTLSLWIWQTSWALVLRLVLVAGLAWATVYVFFPWKKGHRAEAAPAPSVR